MELSALDLFVFGVGAVMLAIWLFLYVIGKQNASLFDPLDENEYPFKEIYFIGYAVLRLIKYKYQSKIDKKLRAEIMVFYGDKYVDYYLRVIHSQRITMGLTVLMLAVPMYGFGNSIAMIPLMGMFAWAAYYYFGTVLENKLKKRSDEMLSDFSNVVSKLALMTNAGMILREAWEEVAATGTSSLYVEMQRSVDEMNNGVSEIDAFTNFGSRCILPEIKKFTSTIVQGLVKGNRELIDMLQQQSSEVWGQRRQIVMRQGQLAASKLLIPIFIMLIGILIMVIIPIFANLGV